MRSYLHRILICALFSASTYGCGTKYLESDVIGVYSLNSLVGVETIDFRKDGSYAEAFQREGSPTTHQVGKWHIEEIEGRKTVVMAHFLPEYQGETGDKGYYLLTISGDRNHIKLVTNPDTEEGYEMLRR